MKLQEEIKSLRRRMVGLVIQPALQKLKPLSNSRIKGAGVDSVPVWALHLDDFIDFSRNADEYMCSSGKSGQLM